MTVEPTTGSLRPKAARGVLQMIVLSVIGTALARVAQFILPLFLLPSDFGLFALATFFMGLLSLFADLGLSTGLVSKREGFDTAANTAFTLRLLTTSSLFASSLGVGWIASRLYDQPELNLLIIVLSLGLFFQAFTMVPRVTASRAMLFGRASIPDNFGKWVGVVLAVGLAILGFGYWSLLYGAITGTAIGGVSQVAWSLLREPKWRPRLAFDPAIARSLMRFGQFVMLAGFANYIAHSIDNAIVGYVLGIAPLGYYSFAYSWGVYLTSNLTSVLSPVGYPVMASVARTQDRLRRALSENIRYFSYVAACLTFGVLTFASVFVRSFYGRQWEPSILPMQLLAPVGILIGYSAICGDALYALGKSRTVFVTTWVEVLVLVLMLLPATIYLGLAGTSGAALLGGIVVHLLAGRYANRATGMSLSDWRGAVQHSLVAGVIASGVGVGLTVAFPSSVLALLAEGSVFIGVYVATLQILTRGVFLADLRHALLLGMRRREGEERIP